MRNRQTSATRVREVPSSILGCPFWLTKICRSICFFFLPWQTTVWNILAKELTSIQLWSVANPGICFLTSTSLFPMNYEWIYDYGAQIKTNEQGKYLCLASFIKKRRAIYLPCGCQVVLILRITYQRQPNWGRKAPQHQHPKMHTHTCVCIHFLQLHTKESSAFS